VIPAAETAVAAAPFRNVRLDISLLINALLFLRFFISAFSSRQIYDTIVIIFYLTVKLDFYYADISTFLYLGKGASDESETNGNIPESDGM
jgi:hypothetical protein